MVKKCQNEEVQQTFRQIQVAEEQRVHDNGVQMRTTKQDGDEDSFESTEVSVWKATESRDKVQKISEGDIPEAPSEGTSNKLQTTRSTESEVQRATNEKSKVGEVTKTDTSKINHEVINVTGSKTSESQQKVQPRSYTEHKS